MYQLTLFDKFFVEVCFVEFFSCEKSPRANENDLHESQGMEMRGTIINLNKQFKEFSQVLQFKDLNVLKDNSNMSE
jgi:hypothetical protein